MRYQLPDHGGTSMAQHGRLAAREYGRHFPLVSPLHGAQAIDAAVQRLQPPRLYPVVDRVRRHARVKELPPPNDAVLPGREDCDHPVRSRVAAQGQWAGTTIGLADASSRFARAIVWLADASDP
jgi:hypothetical protein